jgi:hypothetical protein
MVTKHTIGDIVTINKEPGPPSLGMMGYKFRGYIDTSVVNTLPSTFLNYIFHCLNTNRAGSKYLQYNDLSQIVQYKIIGFFVTNNGTTGYYLMHDVFLDEHFLYDCAQDSYIDSVVAMTTLSNSLQANIDNLVDELLSETSVPDPYPLGGYVMYGSGATLGTIISTEVDEDFGRMYEVYFEKYDATHSCLHEDLLYTGETNWRWEMANNNK